VPEVGCAQHWSARQRSQCVGRRRYIADPGAGGRGSLRHPCCPRPARPVVIARIVAFECRRIDAEFCPPRSIGSGRIRYVDKDITLWVSLQPHPADQIGQLGDSGHSILDRVGRLVSADEGIPHFDDEMCWPVLISLPRNLERGSAQLLPIHSLPRGKGAAGRPPSLSWLSLYRAPQNRHAPARCQETWQPRALPNRPLSRGRSVSMRIAQRGAWRVRFVRKPPRPWRRRMAQAPRRLHCRPAPGRTARHSLPFSTRTARNRRWPG